MTVNIHGKEYTTVNERLIDAHKEENLLSVNTEVLQFTPAVVVKATVTTKVGTFTGISAANPMKAIEKQSPYEVAETSAVGRALGFAGYGINESVATADEIRKATNNPIVDEDEALRTFDEDVAREEAKQDNPPKTASSTFPATKKQQWKINVEMKALGILGTPEEKALLSKYGATVENMTSKQASDIISELVLSPR